MNRIKYTDTQRNHQKRTKKPPAITCKFRSHQLREHLFTKKKGIYNNTNRKINFHVSLTKYRSDLLPQADLYMKENRDDGQVKFYLADANRNLKIKFSYKRNVKFDTFQSFWTGNLETWNMINTMIGTERKFNHEHENETA